MPTTLKHIAFAAALTCGAIAAMPSGVAASSTTPPANAVTEKRPVGAFRAIETAGPYRVIVHAQGPVSVQATGTAAQLADIETVVTGDTLVVRPKTRHMFTFGFHHREQEPIIVITAPMVKSLKASGSGDVDIDQVSGDTFSVFVTGPGDVQAAGTVRDLQVESRGAGDLSLRQLRATNATVRMGGPGEVEMAGLSGALTAEVSGAGDLDATQLRLSRVSVQQRGPGNVHLAGSARDGRFEVSGAGDLEACSLVLDGPASANLRGPGNACVGGTIRKLDAEVHGAGDLSVRGLAASSVKLISSGPGETELQGSTDVLSAELSGSGDLDGRHLQVKTATVRGRGPGDVELATVSESLDADMHGAGQLSGTINGRKLVLRMGGPGDIHLDGHVDSVNAVLTGSGNLEGRGLFAGSSDVQVRGPGVAYLNTKPGTETRTAARAVMIDRSGIHQPSGRD